MDTIGLKIVIFSNFLSVTISCFSYILRCRNDLEFEADVPVKSMLIKFFAYLVLHVWLMSQVSVSGSRGRRGAAEGGESVRRSRLSSLRQFHFFRKTRKGNPPFPLAVIAALRCAGYLADAPFFH